MFERTISCGSLSKTYAITGWRLGYVIAPTPISDEIRKIHDFLTIAAPSPLQEAAVVGLRFPDSYYQQIQSEYSQRRQIFLEYLDQAGIPFTPLKAPISYWQISPVLDSPTTWLSAAGWSKRLASPLCRVRASSTNLSKTWYASTSPKGWILWPRRESG
jgi:aminotransferase